MIRPIREPRLLKGQEQLSRNRRRIQLDVGFKENLPSFIAGERSKVAPIPMGMALTRILAQRKCLTLLAGVGAGNISPAGEWLDMTALGDGPRSSSMAFQGMIPSGTGQRAVTHFEIDPNKLSGLGYGMPVYHSSVAMFPIAQMIFAGEQQSKEKPGHFYLGRTTRDALYSEVISETSGGMVPGKMFAIIAGELEALVYRPLKPEGPVDGRPFTASKDKDADVVWIEQREAFDGYVVASLDSSSYTAVHAHAIAPGNLDHGGHIEEGIVKEGGEVMLLKAHEFIAADDHCS